MRFRLAAALACLVTTTVAAQSPRDALLVSPQWLTSHLHEPNLVILHVGDASKYAAAHIPGARFIALTDISVSDLTGMDHQMPTEKLVGPKNGLMLEMPSAEQLRTQLEKFGISNNSRIVVYQANEYFSPATRVVFTLDYAGLGKNTVMLDGGLDAWTRAKYEIASAPSTPGKPGKLSALTTRPIVTNAKYVHEIPGRSGVALLDARSAAFYDGLPPSRGNSKQRLGHIPGAKNLPFDQMFDEAGLLKSTDALTALFSKAGVQPSDTVVAYCHIGQYATAVLFAARTLGHPVLLYDGSFDEWNKLTQYPVENPSAKANP